MVKVTFFGGAGAVTGSKYLVEGESYKILLDCGLFQGQKELRLRNWEEPQFDPAAISCVILSHAHIDHTGYLPILVKRGFKGSIYCTPGTDELVEMLLLDSGRLQEEEAAFAAKHGTSKHNPPLPLYTEREARDVVKFLKRIPRDATTEIYPGVNVKPVCAGHILGSASITLDLGGKRISFSGDIGRYNAPILPDPQPIALGDLLLCESTYGDRDHGTADPEGELAKLVNEAVNRGGPIIVPAFALGRTQTLLYYLAELERKGAIPVLPVYVDSPMAINVTRLYRTYDYDLDSEAEELIAAKESPLATKKTIYCRTTQESKALNTMKGARIIISASGMATGGRVLHHLMHHLPNERATVFFVGYQGDGTRGAALQSGAKEVKIFGQWIPVKAQIKSISGLSAHGDRHELLRWLKSCSGTPKIVRIVHGEGNAAFSFAALVKTELGWDAKPAAQNEVIEIA